MPRALLELDDHFDLDRRITGSPAIPTAERACLPTTSPNTSTMRSEKPLMTRGCSPISVGRIDHAEHLDDALDAIKASERGTNFAEHDDRSLTCRLLALFDGQFPAKLAFARPVGTTGIAGEEQQLSAADIVDVICGRSDLRRQHQVKLFQSCLGTLLSLRPCNRRSPSIRDRSRQPHRQWHRKPSGENSGAARALPIGRDLRETAAWALRALRRAGMRS